MRQSIDSWFRSVERRIARDVDERGFGLVHVGGRCVAPGCDGDHPSDSPSRHSYTVGLPARFGHPELVVFDMGREAAEFLLFGLANAVVGGLRLEPGVVIDLGQADVRIRVEPVPADLIADGLFAVSESYHASVGLRGRLEGLMLIDHASGVS